MHCVIKFSDMVVDITNNNYEPTIIFITNLHCFCVQWHINAAVTFLCTLILRYVFSSGPVKTEANTLP